MWFPYDVGHDDQERSFVAPRNKTTKYGKLPLNDAFKKGSLSKGEIVRINTGKPREEWSQEASRWSSDTLLLMVNCRPNKRRTLRLQVGITLLEQQEEDYFPVWWQPSQWESHSPANEKPQYFRVQLAPMDFSFTTPPCPIPSFLYKRASPLLCSLACLWSRCSLLFRVAILTYSRMNPFLLVKLMAVLLWRSATHFKMTTVYSNNGMLFRNAHNEVLIQVLIRKINEPRER